MSVNPRNAHPVSPKCPATKAARDKHYDIHTLEHILIKDPKRAIRFLKDTEEHRKGGGGSKGNNSSSNGKGRGGSKGNDISWKGSSPNKSNKGSHNNAKGKKGSKGGKGDKGNRDQSNQNSEELRFLNKLRDRLKTKKEFTNCQEFINTHTDLWQECWEKAGRWNDHELKMLLEFTAQIPKSATVPCPPITRCGGAMRRFLGKAPVTEVISIVINVVTCLMNFMWDQNKETVRHELEETVMHAANGLNFLEHASQAQELKRINEKLQQPWTIKELPTTANVTGEQNSSKEQVLSYDNWKNPTVEWLSTAKFFVAGCLPKMDVPNKRDSDGVYETPEDYMMSLHKLWVGMTFADGNAALMPQCKDKSGSGQKTCGQVFELCSKRLCGRSQCSNTAKYGCPRHLRESLCDPCTKKAQEDLRGPPGKRASPYIYDAVVDRDVNEDGILQLKDFKCRNPPLQVHWKTTKRLSTNNLAAVVKVKTSAQTLGLDSTICWGEVKQHARESRDEWRERENGRVAIGIGAVTEGDYDIFQKNDKVVLIDCLGFVPEWVPVLKAIEEQKETELPFDNGRYLNLCRAHPADTNTILRDCSKEDIDPVGADLDDHIDEMIEHSELKPIMEIRRCPGPRVELKDKLCKLVRKATLDPMQFISFVDSMRNVVHLTQGPPGTGKSYLGIVIVRALLIIRKLWLRCNPSAGNPPILVLSYKNHAINEFLVDLVEAEKYVSLVRIGGSKKTGDPRLAKFTERSYRDADVNTFREHISKLQIYRKTCKGYLSRAKGMVMLDVGTEMVQGLALMIRMMQRVERLMADEVMIQNALEEMYIECLEPNENDDLLRMLPLQSEVEHYEHFCLEDVLYYWLKGWKPCPPCVICGSPSDRYDMCLCPKHKCAFKEGCDEKVEKREKTFLIYCGKHLCAGEDCQGEVVPGQRYCEKHACFKCVDLKQVSNLAMDDPPRNVCADHPLCHTMHCSGFCIPDSYHCGEHQNTTCKGTTKKKNKCTKFALSSEMPFCKDHQNQFKEDETKISAEESVEQATPTVSAVKQCLEQGYRLVVCKPEPEAIQPKQVNEELEKAPETSEKEADAPAPSDSDSEVVAQDLERGNDNPDEQDYATSDECANDQHRRDICDTDSDSDDAVRSSDSESEDVESVSEIQQDSEWDPLSWEWEGDSQQREAACHAFAKEFACELTVLLDRLKGQIKVKRSFLRDAKIKAASRVYEGKEVIGGTMVGCVSRLEAIRGTNPFAVVLEEASEVLEPLVTSCLCSSTCKLEMVGDHYQLQPNAMDKYTYQKTNNISVSMFQRLIEAPPGHMVPSTALSVQRRMRTEICDLTRQYYKDIVQIQDHSICHSRVLGEKEGLGKNLSRQVPGVKPEVFLWTHDGVQGKSDVGVSRCNKMEGDMVVSLVKYLKDCGVPERCIVVITPYKGQLKYIQKKMQDKKYNLQRYDDDTCCRLSTVDRFQGDESDIVIASLVVDERSNTPFVKVQNRMIVLLSRARLATYIVGNKGYFQKDPPKHWMNTFDILKDRTGMGLEICCPLHRDVVMKASSPSDLKFFCQKICTEKLSCSHSCNMKCHFKKSCKQKCDEPVMSPCPEHKKQMPCHKIYEAAVGSRNLGIKAALRNYVCREKVKPQMPCGHVRSMECCEEKAITDGVRSWPQCREQSEVPYIHNTCKHTLQCKCFEYDLYKSDPMSAPPCKKQVDYTPPCGHTVKKECQQKCKYDNGLKYRCKEQVKTTLPRCGHTQTVYCEQEMTMQSWKGKSIEVADCVEQDVRYGPAEGVTCSEKVTFVKRCGHKRIVPCNQAFDLA